MANTKQSRLLDHKRKALGLSGTVVRDQDSGVYRLLVGDEAIELGARWRVAQTALKARAGVPAKR